jgi:hypothetical protein
MNSLNLITLPYSGGRYLVNQTGVVTDNNGNEIESHEIGGKQYLKLEWINGCCNYEKGLVILSAFDKIGFTDELYSRVQVIYKDGDESNCFPENLTYVFNGEPIESHVRGFYLIPGFKDYALSLSGDLINTVTGKNKKWSVQHGASLGSRKPGYNYSILYTGSGRSTTVYLHRLLGIVFLKFSGIFDKLTINHKDGDKCNNKLDNLEWVTYSENNKHAWSSGLMYQKHDLFLMRNLLNEEILSFRSIRECAKYLGEDNGFYISQRLNDKTGTIYPDYLLFKFDDGTDWPVIDSSKIPYTEIGFRNDFVARNVFTGEVFIFRDIYQSKELFNVSPSIVLDHCRNNKLFPYNGFNFRFLLNSNRWPKHTKRHLEIYRDHPICPRDGIVMTDKNTGVETFFTSINKCINIVGIAKAHLNTLIYNKRLFRKQFGFRYFKLRESLEFEVNQQPS